MRKLICLLIIFLLAYPTNTSAQTMSCTGSRTGAKLSVVSKQGTTIKLKLDWNERSTFVGNNLVITNGTCIDCPAVSNRNGVIYTVRQNDASKDVKIEWVERGTRAYCGGTFMVIPANSNGNTSAPVAAAPALVGQWTFDGSNPKADKTGNFNDLNLRGATIENGKLKIARNQWANATGYKGAPIKDKTLVAWAKINNLGIRGGSILTLDKTDMDNFDGIVYGELRQGQWIAGSSWYRRTKKLGNTFTETAGTLVQLAISYRATNGGTEVAIYRNGTLLEKYIQGGLPTYHTTAEAVFGARHTGGTRNIGTIDGVIEEARIYSGVLNGAAIKALTLGSNSNNGSSSSVASGNTLNVNQELPVGKKLTSANGGYSLEIQSDGNLCFKSTGATEKVPGFGWGWCAFSKNPSGKILKLQADGNLVIYNASNQMVWSSKTSPSDDTRFNTAANKPVKLLVGDDGTLKLYNASGVAVWSNKSGVALPDPSITYMSPTSRTQFEAFLNTNGGRTNYSKRYVDALRTMITVEDLVKVNNYQQAKKELDKLWAAYPIGDEKWNLSTADDRKYKTNIGSPAAYNALRMLTDIVNHNLSNPNPSDVKTATLRVVLVECSEGKQPKTVAQMKSEGGSNQKNTLDSRIKVDNHRIINQSLDLFLRYVNAITDGKLKVEVKYYDLKNYCAPTFVTKDGKRAAMKSYSDALSKVPQDIQEATDWWWVIYPSRVPEDGVDGVTKDAGFDGNYVFVTGGIGAYGRDKPAFIIDDKWLLRVPPHMGKGPISDIERRAYLPQWLQHEFFHHLYGSYSELGFEPTSHDWQLPGRQIWIDFNFSGLYEADYYQETLHKHLKSATPNLDFKLYPTYKPSAAILNTLNINQFLNKTFDVSDEVRERSETPNGWHIGKIIQENGKYYWKNNANVKWEIQPDFTNGMFKNLSTTSYPGKHFSILFKKDPTGAYINQIEGLIFQGGLYKLK